MALQPFVGPGKLSLQVLDPILGRQDSLDQGSGPCLPTGQHKRVNTYTSVHLVRFEPATPVSERAQKANAHAVQPLSLV